MRTEEFTHEKQAFVFYVMWNIPRVKRIFDELCKFECHCLPLNKSESSLEIQYNY